MTEELDFSEALYKYDCQECGETIDWEAQFDADGTDYIATCCLLRYRMIPSKVIVETEDKEKDGWVEQHIKHEISIEDAVKKGFRDRKVWDDITRKDEYLLCNDPQRGFVIIRTDGENWEYNEPRYWYR